MTTTDKMTLTNEQIARVFAMYGNQHILEEGNNKGDLLGIYHTETDDRYRILTNCSSGQNYWSPLEMYKLLLTPLSAISDEDAIQVAKIAGYNEQIVSKDRDFNCVTNEVDVQEIERKKDCIKMSFNHICFEGFLTIRWDGSAFFTDEENENKEYVSATNFIHQFLIQRGYAVPLFIDVDHPDNGKTAIELGIAISKTHSHDHR